MHVNSKYVYMVDFFTTCFYRSGHSFHKDDLEITDRKAGQIQTVPKHYYEPQKIGQWHVHIDEIILLIANRLVVQSDITNKDCLGKVGDFWQ